MPAIFSPIRRGTMLGLASGILSQSALATVLSRRSSASLPGIFANRWTRRLVEAGAAGEVVANAFVTSLPPRTDAGPLGGRILLGTIAGGLAGSTSGKWSMLGAASGGTAAPLGAWISTTGRRTLSKHVPDKLIAVVETVVAFGLSRMATK